MRMVHAAAVALKWQTYRRFSTLCRRVGLSPSAPARPLFRLPSSPGQVAITIDDGPHPEWTPLVLDVLAREDVTATFFMVGDSVVRHPDLARRVLADGHAIGNHTMHHTQPFSALSPTALRREIADASSAIAEATGVSPRLFRAPAGSWSARVLDTVGELGMLATDWSVDPEDWRPRPPAELHERISAAQAADIVLCHDGGGDRSGTVTALSSAIPALRAGGMSFAGPEALYPAH